MTCALVNPTCGYSTFSRLTSLSCRVPMRTSRASRELIRASASPSLFPRFAFSCRGEALRKCIHQVDDLAARLLLRGLGDDLLALRLPVEQREHLFTERVLVFRRFEIRRERLHE